MKNPRSLESVTLENIGLSSISLHNLEICIFYFSLNNFF